jgi:asparagine synthase (glutamine-hydrolysing)
MCGITGYLASEASSFNGFSNSLKDMTRVLSHRGPDDEDIWTDPDSGIGLGHRRLSILDTSEMGRQPMQSASGRYRIVFNGEIYNFRELRQKLESRNIPYDAPFILRGNSDTEIMLAAIEAWGLLGAIQQFVGMFAFALWDEKNRVLHLVRDRVGIKPLYYGKIHGAFVFASELKSICQFPGFAKEIDRHALSLLMRFGYIPAPHSIYRGIFKLTQGTILSMTNKGSSMTPIPYWSLKDAAEVGMREPFCGTEIDAADQLDSLLRDAVKLRMISDVPLGAFLSGGIDSSTVVAMMQAQNSSAVKTFSIGFEDKQFDESHYAKFIAQKLETDHTELVVSPQNALDIIPRLPTLYDEPFADVSQIPTFLLSQLARQQVTVSLSGDGGDELYCGYDRYQTASSLFKSLSRIPKPLRSGIANILSQVSPKGWNRALSPVIKFLKHRWQRAKPGFLVPRFGELIKFNNRQELYLQMISHWNQPIVISDNDFIPALDIENPWSSSENYIEELMFLDMMTNLPDDILTKVDRASMGVGLEVRVPLLDHRVVEFAWKLPLSFKQQGKMGKSILRQVLGRYLPTELFDRPKMGFAVPIGHWLRGPLREWAEDLLDANRLRQEGYLDSQAVQRVWQDHQKGIGNWQYYLWNVLMFQAWLKENKG